MKLFELIDSPVKAWAIAPCEKALGFHKGVCEFFSDTPFDKVLIRQLNDDEPFTMTFDDGSKITHTAKEWCTIYSQAQNEIIASSEY